MAGYAVNIGSAALTRGPSAGCTSVANSDRVRDTRS